jgi:hypothetical protein
MAFIWDVVKRGKRTPCVKELAWKIADESGEKVPTASCTLKVPIPSEILTSSEIPDSSPKTNPVEAILI